MTESLPARLTPLACDGDRVSPNIDIKMPTTRIAVSLLGPSGLVLASDAAKLELVPFEGAPAGVGLGDDNSTLRIQYKTNICGVARLRVTVDGQDVAGSPRLLEVNIGNSLRFFFLYKNNIDN